MIEALKNQSYYLASNQMLLSSGIRSSVLCYAFRGKDTKPSITGSPNVIVPSLLHSAEPLHLLSCSCSKLKSVSCALACCIVVGINTNPADSIATAATIPTISKVEMYFILSSSKESIVMVIYLL